MSSSIYQSCVAIHGPNDMENLLECSLMHMEMAQDTVKSDVNGFLLVISVRSCYCVS